MDEIARRIADNLARVRDQMAEAAQSVAAGARRRSGWWPLPSRCRPRLSVAFLSVA